MGIEIVMLDWNHPDWYGTYYPQDLPQEWQLAYFATNFEAVLVPALAWQATPLEVLTQWADEVPERFRFYLETLPENTPAILDRASVALGQRYAGRVESLPSAQASDVPDATRHHLSNPSLAAVNTEGLPMLAQQIPDGIQADPRSTLNWFQALATEAGPRPALAILADNPADTLSRLIQLVQLAGLA